MCVRSAQMCVTVTGVTALLQSRCWLWSLLRGREDFSGWRLVKAKRSMMTGIAPDPFSFPFHSNNIIITVNTGNLSHMHSHPNGQNLKISFLGADCQENPASNEKVSMFVDRCKEIIHQLNNLITHFCIVKVAEPCAWKGLGLCKNPHTMHTYGAGNKAKDKCRAQSCAHKTEKL